METVSIEKKTFEELMAQWDAFVEKVTALQRKGDGKRVCCTTSLKEEYFLEQLALNY